MIIPSTAMYGIVLIIFGMLNLYEKNEKIRSMPNWVIKFIKTNVPKREYEMPYCS